MMSKAFSTCLMLLSINLISGQDQYNPDPNCVCVPYYNCLKNNTINRYGRAVINIRLGEERQCEDAIDVCCSLTDTKSSNVTSEPPKPYVPTGCGNRNVNEVDFRISGDVDNIANENEFPWMVLVMKKEIINGTQANVYQCGGSLINKRVILTAAHCLKDYSESELLVRAGEWNTSNKKERLPYQDRKVTTIVKHPQFDGSYLGHNFALLFLTTPFELADNVDVVCLPEKNEIIDSKKCIVTGWGKNNFGGNGKFSTILKAIELPIVSSNECQERLRKTKLSKYFELHPSFICAGGVPGQDACEGDGGSPLVCPLKEDPDRYVQAGIVSWGIGCNNDIPAAYAKVSLARPWIDETLSKYRIDSASYTSRNSQS